MPVSSPEIDTLGVISRDLLDQYTCYRTHQVETLSESALLQPGGVCFGLVACSVHGRTRQSRPKFKLQILNRRGLTRAIISKTA